SRLLSHHRINLHANGHYIIWDGLQEAPRACKGITHDITLAEVRKVLTHQRRSHPGRSRVLSQRPSFILVLDCSSETPNVLTMHPPTLWTHLRSIHPLIGHKAPSQASLVARLRPPGACLTRIASAASRALAHERTRASPRCYGQCQYHPLPENHAPA